MESQWTSSTPETSTSSNAASASAYPVRHEEEAVERRGNVRTSREHSSVPNNVEYPRTTTVYDETQGAIREDTWYCIVVLIIFWFFVAMTLILGVFGDSNLQLTPNSSILIKPNPWFVESIKVKQVNEAVSGLVLYGLYSAPLLDVVKISTENHTTILLTSSYKEWMYILNEGSQISISYSIASSSSVILIVAKGSESLAEWIADPTYSNSTLSWNAIQGNGLIQQSIPGSSTYYVAVGNLNSEEVQVNVNVSVKSYMYNTSDAYYKCTVAHRTCGLKLLFTGGNLAVLTSSQSVSANDWYVKLSYGPRWITYVVGIGVMTFVMFLFFHILNNFQFRRVENGDQRAPLLPRKDSDLSSWGSSYDSVSDHDEELEETMKDRGELNKDNVRRLCASCFDAPRDCFFLPCGHCAACFTCGSRITEVTGTCPICCKNVRKVRKIFTV